MVSPIFKLFLIGHVLGDFYFQSSDLARNKDKSLKELLKHSLIYFSSMVFAVIPVFSFNIVKWALMISIAHLIVDLAKLMLKNKIIIDDKLDTLLYSIDQIVHVVIIAFIVITMYLIAEPVNYIYRIEHILNRLEVDLSSIISWILIILVNLEDQIE